jgi:diguanylate cyclase (GGDEF)-like protein
MRLEALRVGDVNGTSERRLNGLGRAWLRRRGVGSSAGDVLAPGQSPLRARALGSLYLAGATIGLVSLLLPHSAKADDAGLYSNVGLAYVGGFALVLGATRLRVWMLHVTLVAGILLITRAILLSGEPVSFYSVWFIWVGLYAFYFFGRPAAAAYVTLVSVLYGATLVDAPETSAVARWLTTVATLIVAGVFIDTLVRRARRDAGAAAASERRMALVASVAHELAGLSESAFAHPAVCSAAARATNADGAALWEPGADGTGLLLVAYAGLEPTRHAIPFAGPPAGASQAFTSGAPVADRAATATRRLAVEFSGRDRGPIGGLWQPIAHENTPVAVLGLYWQDPSALDDPSVNNLTDLLAAEVAVTLERIALLARLESIARTDELTGLPNRRAWQEALPREVARALRSNEPLCVAMLDLDHFKDYNDQRGHQAGDRLLKQLAGAWSDELRASDTLARYGGEEFALLLPACSLESAIDVVARLREVTPDRQTCSAGITYWDGSDAAADLIGQADRALYEAKRAGRDRTVCTSDAQLI